MGRESQLPLFDTEGHPAGSPQAPPPRGEVGQVSHAPADTRREAYLRILPQMGRMGRTVLQYVLAQREKGATDEEIAEATKLRESTARARRVELRDLGVIVDSGQRRKTRSRRLAIVWRASCIQTAGDVK